MAEVSSAAIGAVGEEQRIGLELPAGFRCATPVLAVLLLGFLAPLLTVAAYAFATPRSFDAFRTFTLANFATIFDPANTVWISFAWSLFLAFTRRVRGRLEFARQRSSSRCDSLRVIRFRRRNGKKG